MITKDFFQKILVVLVGIFIFRLGTYLPVPFVDPATLALYAQQKSGTILDIFNTFSGGSIERFSIFAIGIMPYISASIIIQMGGYFVESLKQLKESGEKGQLKLNLYTRYLTLGFAVLQAIALTSHLSGQGVNGVPLVSNPDMSFFAVSVASLVFGTMFLLWLGEKLTEYGLGSGISVIIFAGICSGFPNTFFSIATMVQSGSINLIFAFLILVFFVLFIAFIIFVEKSQRRIKLSTASQYDDEKGYLPLKINLAGIIPVIFASSLIALPATIINFFGKDSGSDILATITAMLSRGGSLYFIILSLLVLFFCFFYSKLVFDPKKASDKLRQSGAFLKGIRPGEFTEKYLKTVSQRMTLIGAIYLIAISVVPEILLIKFNVPFYLGGTSLLIIALVALEWHKQYLMHQQSQTYSKLKNNLMNKFE
jgi:preprotein translocase subunit SecY